MNQITVSTLEAMKDKLNDVMADVGMVEATMTCSEAVELLESFHEGYMLCKDAIYDLMRLETYN